MTPKLTPIRDETGKLQYPGSLAMSVALTPGQKDAMKELLQKGPETPTSLVQQIESLPNYNPHSAESVRRWLAQLEQSGTVQQCKDANGKLLGWQWKDTDQDGV